MNFENQSGGGDWQARKTLGGVWGWVHIKTHRMEPWLVQSRDAGTGPLHGRRKKEMEDSGSSGEWPVCSCEWGQWAAESVSRDPRTDWVAVVLELRLDPDHLGGLLKHALLDTSMLDISPRISDLATLGWGQELP